MIENEWKWCSDRVRYSGWLKYQLEFIINLEFKFEENWKDACNEIFSVGKSIVMFSVM